jgi:ferritin
MQQFRVGETMNKEIFSKINEQIVSELYNSLIYLSISNFYYQQKFDGLGAYFKKQSTEEKEQAEKFIDYLLKFEIGQQIALAPIPPVPEWQNLFIPLDASLSLEQSTTSQINALMELATNTSDYATIDVLQWFINEQVKEENQLNYLITQAKLDGSYNPLALRLLNDELL